MENKIIAINISPATDEEINENAGVMWEHNATALVFNIDSSYVGDYRYYIEYRSLIGTKVRTEYLELNIENNTVTYQIPVTMTSLRGVECYFNIVKINEDGETVQVIKPKKFCLQFDYSPDTDNSLAKVNDFSINALLEAIRTGAFKGEPGDPIANVDDKMSDTSTNPVQNKVIYATFEGLIKDLEKGLNSWQSSMFTQANNAFVAKEDGKGLSSNDFTDDYKAKLDNMDDSDEVYIEQLKTELDIFTDISGASVSANLCDNEFEYGWIDDDGSNKDTYTPITVSFRTKNYIEVEGGREICYNNNFNSTTCKIWQYDADRKMIGEKVSLETSINIYSGTKSIVLDANTKYVRLGCYTTEAKDLATVQLNLYYVEDKNKMFTDAGNVFVYVPRYTSVGGFVDSKKVLTPLTGKKIVYDGDSIAESRLAYAVNGGGYAKLIADLTTGIYDNQAVGGGRLTTRTDGKHSVVDNLANLPPDGDLYCFQGGINDYWANSTLGTYDKADFTGTLDTDTVCGALETIFRYALNNFVGKPVCFVITHKIQNTAYIENSNGDTFEDYRNAMVGICNKYSIPYYDAFTESSLNGWNTAQNNAFLTANTDGTADGCHPNEEGYKKYYVPQLISLFEKIMPR